MCPRLSVPPRRTAPGQPPFPGTICASVNREVCHGIPDERVLGEGDIVGIDIGLIHDGWHADSAETMSVGAIDAEAERLLQTTDDALWRAIDAIAAAAWRAESSAVRVMVPAWSRLDANAIIP